MPLPSQSSSRSSAMSQASWTPFALQSLPASSVLSSTPLPLQSASTITELKNVPSATDRTGGSAGMFPGKPQVTRLPSARSAAEIFSPACTLTTGTANRFAGTVVWPLEFVPPQQRTEPSARSTTVCVPPSAMSVTCVRFAGAPLRGVARPQPKIVPFGRSTRFVEPNAAISVATAASAGTRCTLYPEVSGTPHARTAPSVRNARKWLLPAASFAQAPRSAGGRCWGWKHEADERPKVVTAPLESIAPAARGPAAIVTNGRGFVGRLAHGPHGKFPQQPSVPSGRMLIA